jgi:transcriptional repressor NrdR
MFCPFCHCEDTKVVDKRDNPDTGVVRRRRECLTCTKRFTTYERIESIQLNVEKRNGTIESFDRSKLKSSILKALRKQNRDEKEVDELVDQIEMKLLNNQSTIVKTEDIGRMVLSKLKKLDKVAYLRFVSVYRDFDTIEKFENELKNL